MFCDHAVGVHTNWFSSFTSATAGQDFHNAGIQVKLITESPDGTNTGRSSHSSHLKDEKKKMGGDLLWLSTSWLW